MGAMRHIQASDAEAGLSGLLDEVERGASIVIMRNGRPVARLVPETVRRDAEVRAAIADMEAFGRDMPRLSDAERRSLIEAGRKY